MTDKAGDKVTHDLKIWPEHFAAVVSGRKAFEVRKDDRGYREGDTLHLMEWEPDNERFTGAETWMAVTVVSAVPFTDLVGLGIEPTALTPVPPTPTREDVLAGIIDEGLGGHWQGDIDDLTPPILAAIDSGALTTAPDPERVKELVDERAQVTADYIAMRKERDRWKSEANRHAGNADYWRVRAETMLANVALEAASRAVGEGEGST